MITPRGCLEGRNPFAILGTALPVDGYPLYFDAINEKGLGMAGLLFPKKACYLPPREGKENIPSYALIPHILGKCTSVKEVESFLERVNITNEAFSEDLPPSPLHWMIADKEQCLVVEQTGEGLFAYQNPAGVLTNAPEFPFQMECLNQFMGLSPEEPENRFSKALNLSPNSRGLGALGLPGDLSSPSRFVRACFHNLNSVRSGNEKEDVVHFFHILDSVCQVKGCNRVGEDWEFTRYSSCFDLERGIYYYTTYHNRRISAIELRNEEAEGDSLMIYEQKTHPDILYQNQGIISGMTP